MEIKKTDHVGLIVKDMEQAVRFYTQVMGFALTGEITPWAGSPEECAAMQVPEGTDYRCAMLELPGGVQLQLMEFSRMEPPGALGTQGAYYLSFLVDDLSAWVKKLEENGCRAMSAPLFYDEFGKTIQWCYITDPNGVIFELMSE